MSEMFGLDGKVAVITGGSRGIGRAIAAGFASAGADVVIASRKLDNCTAAAAQIGEETGRRALPAEFHAGRWADCDRLVDTVYREFGRCDVLVNNAGMSPLYPGLASVTEEYYDKVHAVNLKGPFRLGVLAGTRMASGEGGSIINVSSIGSLRPGPDELVYACAKAGLNALTVGLAGAFGPRVRSNAILPGAVLTDIASSWPEERLRLAGQGVPLGRPGQPADLVGTALWLASRASEWVTGVMVRVDGGMYRQLLPRETTVIDFTVPDDIKQVRGQVAAFIDTNVLPAEAEIGTRPYFDIVAGLQAKARAAGLWCPFIPAEWGGMGLGHLANAIVQIEVGRSPLAAWAMNCMGPQDATMLTLLEHGTEEQKERFLVPLVNAEKRICFSMTERAAGSDATGMRTTAVRDGEEWILNGEKWFSSSASISDYALVMARTDPGAPRHRQFSTFLVELPDPGYQIIRDIPTLHEAVAPSVGGHAEVRIAGLRVPHANVIGEVGGGFAMGQHRLGYGRLRHGMWSIAKAQRALDMAAQHALERETFGQPLAERQGVQWLLADCARDLYIARLMVLHIAYKMEHGLDIGQENSIAKNFIADMLSSVVDTALQIHGALGYTMDTPLAAWYAEVRMQHLVDGPDEVHRWRIGRNVLAAQRKSGSTASAAGGDLF